MHYLLSGLLNFLGGENPPSIGVVVENGPIDPKIEAIPLSAVVAAPKEVVRSFAPLLFTRMSVIIVPESYSRHILEAIARAEQAQATEQALYGQILTGPAYARVTEMREKRACFLWSNTSHGYWRPDGAGYTDKPLEAGLFSEEYVRSIEAAPLGDGKDTAIPTDIAIRCVVENLPCPPPSPLAQQPNTGTSDHDLVERAVRNARPRGRESGSRWAAVTAVFGIGSTRAVALCHQYGLDPDEELEGCFCEECPLCDEEDDGLEPEGFLCNGTLPNGKPCPYDSKPHHHSASFYGEGSGYPPGAEPVPAGPRSCNRHEDCDAAEAQAALEGKPELYGQGSSRLHHCSDEGCEECFGS